MTSRILMTGGVVYSTVSPFATAIYVEHGTVGWVGDDAAAQVQADEADVVVDLAGSLVTPGFVRGCAGSRTVDPHGGPSGELSRVGIVGLVDTLASIHGPGQWVVDLDQVPGLVEQGLPFGFAIDAPPWEVVREASSSIATRAAFAAHTRGGWRLAGVDAGVIEPGYPAHLAVWQAPRLQVQVPDGRVAAWSTDPRSGTPGLPDLSSSLPVCLMTMVDGIVTYDSGVLESKASVS